MDKSKNLNKFSGRKPLLVILTLILLLTTVFSQAAPSQKNEADRQHKIVHQVAQKWIEVGVEQYRRGFFRAAEQSFLRARDYEEYLTAAEREELSELLEKTHIAAIEQKRILEHIQTASELLKQGQLIKAKAHFESLRDNKFLTKEQRELITGWLEKIGNKLDEQKKQIAELYSRSVEFYRGGEFEKAREGFIKVAKSGLLAAPAGETAEEYLAKIDEVLARKVEPSPLLKAKAEKELPEPTVPAIEPAKADKRPLGALEEELLEVETKAAAEVEEEVEEQVVKEQEAPVVVAAEPAPDEGSYIEVVNRRRNIRRSYTRTVVNDAVAKAQNYIMQGEFGKAKEAVETAERTVNESQLDLGDALFRQYSSELKQLNAKIAREQNELSRRLQEQRRLDAIEAQRRYRGQMEADRSKRIAELMENAVAYQKQQRYEEALGQLEMLLSLDPLNDQSLLLRQTLEDTVNFRKQLEMQKETDKERFGILMKADESMIPYAEELTYPKNWREIVAKRKPEEAIGQDPADIAVYKQLDEIVDLSELSAEMPFGEAIDELRNSVEPPLKISPNWRDLYDVDIDQTTPINMDPVSAIPLRAGLELLLENVSGVLAELGYVVSDGVIRIATIESLPSKLETLVYDVTDLLGRPADFYAVSESDVSGVSGEEGVPGFEEGEELDRSQLADEAAERADALVILLQETIEPDSWDVYGGEGTIRIHENKKLIVRNTREVHNQLEDLFKEMRKSLGHQVAIEARFLLVGENFLEDIGLDVDILYRPGGKLGEIRFDQRFVVDPGLEEVMGIVEPRDTEVPGSLAGSVASVITGGYGTFLDDLQVSVLLRATQAHRDSTTLTAPKVNVLSGEMATMRVQRVFGYATDVEVDFEDIGIEGAVRTTVDYEEEWILVGTTLNVTPTISWDRKYVLLNIVAELRDFLGFSPFEVPVPIIAGAGVRAEPLTILFPDTEISRVETRVSVPDGGTLLLGGQKVTAEVEREAGVPILSKIPIIGRAFSSRSKIRDNKILLILVKPTIILQEEAEAEAIAAMESDF